jgi:dolichol-phosphate mannosyltransferase
MDCDLQDPPEAIPQLYAKAAEGYDVVLARRELRHDHVAKRATSWFFYQVFGYLTGIKWDRKIGVFRIVSKTVVEQLRQLREQMRFTVGLIEWLGFPTASVNVQHSERLRGKSTYTPRTLWRLGSSAVIAYSDKPLRLAIRLGFTISVLAFAAGIYIIGRYFAYDVITGWSSLIVSVFFMGGIIVSILGVIGIYLGRVFEETKGRPLYVIRRRVNL